MRLEGLWGRPRPSAEKATRCLAGLEKVTDRDFLVFAPALDPRLAGRSNRLIPATFRSALLRKSDVGLWHNPAAPATGQPVRLLGYFDLSLVFCVSQPSSGQ
jgi:hypothetical protein